MSKVSDLSYVCLYSILFVLGFLISGVLSFPFGTSKHWFYGVLGVDRVRRL